MADIDYGHDGLGEEDESPHRKRCWMALCYPDNEEMNNWWLNTLPGIDFGYVGRIHDQEGKAHHHVVFVFPEAKTQTAVSLNVSYPVRWLRPWDSKRKAMRYLCHCDNPEKFQYDVNGLYGSLVDEATKYCSKGSAESETKSAIDVFDLLDSIDGYLRFSDFARICAEKGLWSTFRRMGVMGSRLIDDHNTAFTERRRQEQVQSSFDRFNDYLKSGFSKSLTFEQWIEFYERNGTSTLPPL